MSSQNAVIVLAVAALLQASMLYGQANSISTLEAQVAELSHNYIQAKRDEHTAQFAAGAGLTPEEWKSMFPAKPVIAKEQAK